MNTRIKTNSGVTLLGLIAVIAVMGLAFCFLYIAKLMVASAEDSAKKRQAKMDAAGEDDPELAKLGQAPWDQLALSTPGAVWTPLTNDPGWFIIEIPDDEWWAAIDSYQTWAILESSDLVTWRDSGTTLDGTLWSVKQDLRNWSTNEAAYARWGGAHAHGRTMHFYFPVDPSEVPPPNDDPGK